MEWQENTFITLVLRYYDGDTRGSLQMENMNETHVLFLFY